MTGNRLKYPNTQAHYRICIRGLIFGCFSPHLPDMAIRPLLLVLGLLFSSYGCKYYAMSEYKVIIII